MNRVTRRQFLARGAVGGFALVLARRLSASANPVAAQPAPIPMMVYSDPACGCCGKWISLMGSAGFRTTVQNTSDMAGIKKRYGIGVNLASCHTALVGGYLVEGHVPADLIKKMLAEKPAIAGLAVPGMVTGSPGMEGATKDPYDVIAFDKAGKTSVYAHR